MTSLLETRGLRVTFGGLHANDDVDLTVEEGRFVGLIGPNGAGKTTFIDAITGFVPLSGGTVTFAGDDITDVPAHQRATRGLVRTFQSLELFEDLSVRENLLAASERATWRDALADVFRPNRRSPVAEDVNWALDLVELTDAADRLPSDLSHGQRKLVSIARAAAARPRLILLDEPAAGLDSGESRQLGVELRSLLDESVTVLLIDHDMDLVLGVCDEVYVLDFGRIIAHGTPEEIRRDPAVVAAYLGAGSGS